MESSSLTATIRVVDSATEFFTSERCWILETWNVEQDPELSIARARVERGVTTQLHRLRGIDERYLIVEGTAEVRIGDQPSARVGPGDIVVIPRDMAQRISNVGDGDLIFYCICSPRFSPEHYEKLEDA